MNTLVRGGGRQVDFHVPPVWVEGGDEKFVLVERGRYASSKPVVIGKISSFLGVMPGDIVEVAVDVVDTDSQVVIYSRSLHKETLGIYDAWDHQLVWGTPTNFEVVITCRVNGNNRDGECKAFFEGLVRVEVS